MATALVSHMVFATLNSRMVIEPVLEFIPPIRCVAYCSDLMGDDEDRQKLSQLPEVDLFFCIDEQVGISFMHFSFNGRVF